MKLSTLKEWLAWIDGLHPSTMELGLDRVKAVAQRLGVLKPTCPVIMVAGTNGKGSTVTTLESIYRSAQYRTACFTSPFLFKPNEQVRINQQMVTDQVLCDAFLKVEQTRGEISLTSFEFFTLAAFVIFKSHELDIMILEIGLGGRLDAVNIIDADLAIVTNIDIDHVEYLGPTREHIGFEKAGIFKIGKPAISGDRHPPHTLLERAKKLGIPLFVQGEAFDYREERDGWVWVSKSKTYDHLPFNQLHIENMATVIMAITLMQTQLPVSEEAIIQGLKTVSLPGRVQIIPGKVIHIFDVAHNPHGVAYLKKQLIPYQNSGQIRAVFSMLADKDIQKSIEIMKDTISEWYVGTLEIKRGASLPQLKNAFYQAKIQSVQFYSSIKQAYQQALLAAKVNDVIIVFGSFHTVAAIMEAE